MRFVDPGALGESDARTQGALSQSTPEAALPIQEG